jgi:cytoskeletal protein CcmA (bactofilin family)
VVVNGRVEGPIVGQDVVLKSRAFVTGDIQAQTLSIEPGAHFESAPQPSRSVTMHRP